jgi:hypothetical protein
MKSFLQDMPFRRSPRVYLAIKLAVLVLAVLLAVLLALQFFFGVV